MPIELPHVPPAGAVDRKTLSKLMYFFTHHMVFIANAVHLYFSLKCVSDKKDRTKYKSIWKNIKGQRSVFIV